MTDLNYLNTLRHQMHTVYAGELGRDADELHGFTTIAADLDLNVIVLTGGEEVFSAGLDMQMG